MNKVNYNRGYSIVGELREFVKRLTLLSSEFIKLMKEFDEGDEWDSKYIMIKHAYLVYSFALLEIYQKIMIEHILNKEKDVQIRYSQLWNDFIKTKRGKKFDDYSDSDSRSAYKTLIDEAGFGTEDSLIILLLNFDEDGQVGKALERSTHAYRIFREMRNMIVHRGDKIDAELIKCVKRFNKKYYNSRDLSTLIFRILQSEIESVNFDTILDKLIEEYCNFPFFNVINILLSRAIWQTSLLINLEDNQLAYIYSDLLSLSEDNEITIHLYNVINIFQILNEIKYKNNVEDINDQEKIQFILSIDLLKKIRDNQEGPSTDIEVGEEFYLDDKIRKRLIDNYLKFKFDHDEYCHLVKNFISEEDGKFNEVFRTMKVNDEDYQNLYIFNRQRLRDRDGI